MLLVLLSRFFYLEEFESNHFEFATTYSLANQMAKPYSLANQMAKPYSLAYQCFFFKPTELGGQKLFLRMFGEHETCSTYKDYQSCYGLPRECAGQVTLAFLHEIQSYCGLKPGSAG